MPQPSGSRRRWRRAAPSCRTRALRRSGCWPTPRATKPASAPGKPATDARSGSAGGGLEGLADALQRVRDRQGGRRVQAGDVLSVEHGDGAVLHRRKQVVARDVAGLGAVGQDDEQVGVELVDALEAELEPARLAVGDGQQLGVDLESELGEERGGTVVRSEEHTSELQSLMRISYAV